MCTRACSPPDFKEDQCKCDRENRYCFEPLTYYKNEQTRRAFLLISCPQRPDDHQVCYLVEFGHTQQQIVSRTAAEFQQLLTLKKLIPFTPQYPDNDW